MKMLIVIFLTGLALAMATPASAFRYEWQTIQIRQAMEKKRAENLARTKQGEARFEGRNGVRGKVGPGTYQPRAGRPDPSAHP